MVRLLNKYSFLVKLISIVVICIALSVCIGTFYKITLLTSISPSWINMKINTAICFLMAGFTLLLLNNKNLGFYTTIIILVVSISILVINILNVYGYLFNVDLGIDQLIVKEQFPHSPGTISPGRMTFITAINFILLALAFLFSLKKSMRASWVVQTLAWLILLIAFISFNNYINETDINYMINKYTTMSLYTTILFILLSLGILLLKPDKGITGLILKHSTGGYVLRFLLLILIIIPIVINLIENHFEKKNLIDAGFGSTINSIGDFIIIGMVILLLSKLIDSREKALIMSQSKLEESDLIFHQLVENIDMVFFTASPDLNEMRYISPAYEKIWGRSTHSLYKNPKDWFESILTEDQEAVYKAIFIGLNEEHPSASIEYRIKRPDGSIRNIFARSFRVKDERQNVLCIVGIAMDMTKTILENLYKKLQSDILHLIETEKKMSTFIPKALKSICLSLHWDLGELWLVDKSRNILTCIHGWNRDYNSLHEFAQNSKRQYFYFGEGFPGWVWKAKKAAWISDYSLNSKYSRSNYAATAGLNSAVGIPIIFNNNVFGILDFFSFKIKKIDTEHLKLMEVAAKYIGEYIKQIHSIEQIQIMSRVDLLTGLLNRAAFGHEIDSLISERKLKSIAIMMLDIDRFKLINDALGHENGDILLKSVAARLQELIPNTTKTSRLGDKYILYFPEMNRSNTLEYANNIIESFSVPFDMGENKVHLSASIGIAFYPQDGLESETLIKNADIAMINARNLEGNRINFFDEELALKASNKFILLNEIHQAIVNNQFFLEYQPQIDLKTEDICSAEALVRWQHPDRGVIYPGDFINLAEESGLIVSINEHIMHMVFKEMSSNRLALPISINISVEQFRDGFHLVEYLLSLMKRFHVDSKFIELEITENMLMENSEHNINVLSALNKLGFQIAIDDFGTGFSSFSYLNQLPINKIKIDKAFISGVSFNPEKAKITKSIIAMFHSLGKIVVAEGAETQAEVELLKQQNCDIIQGYYYYRPISLDDLITKLKRS